MFQRLLFFLQILIGMEAQEDDDMEVDAGQELVIIPVRDKGKDAKLVKAFSTSTGITTIQIRFFERKGNYLCRKNLVGRYKRIRTKASRDTWNMKKWGHSTSTKYQEEE